MDDTVGDENIRNDDFSAVDEDVVAVNVDGYIGTAEGLELLVIFEHGGVADCAVHNVVLQDGGQVLGAEIAQGAKMVRSGVVSRASTSSARVRAPTRPLKPAATAVEETFWGGTRRELIGID